MTAPTENNCEVIFMIDHIGYETNFGSVSNSAGARTEELRLGFAEFLADKAASSENPVSVRIAAPGAHGYVGDGQVFIPPELFGGSEDALNDVLSLLMSLNGDAESIWDIVLRLEEKVDIEALSESIAADPENPAGLSFAAALLTGFWKKKELSGNGVSESGGDIYAYAEQERLEDQIASELEALIRKRKTLRFNTR